MEYTLDDLEIAQAEAFGCFSQLPGVSFEKTNSYCRIKSVGFPILFNQVFCSRFQSLEEVDRLIQDYRNSCQSFAFRVWPTNSPNDLEDHLSRNGFRLLDTTVCLSLGRSQFVHSFESKSAEFDLIESHDSRNSWIRIFCDGFQVDQQTAAAFSEYLNLSTPRATHFLLSKNGTPACCVSLFQSERIVGIYNLATDPRYRQQGLGSMIVRMACQYAFTELKAHLLYAFALPSSYKLFKSVGFKDQCFVKTFGSPEFRHDEQRA